MSSPRRSHDGRRIPVRVRPRRRPRLEALEARVVLSTTYTVTTLADASPPTGTLSLRQAIADADADGNTDPAHPDIIEFAVTGTIVLDSPLPAIAGSLAIEGPGESSLTIEVSPSYTAGVFSLLPLAANSMASLDGLTIDGAGSAEAITVAQGAGLVVGNTAIESAGFGSNVNNPPSAILANQSAGAIAIEDSQFANNSGASIFDEGDSSLTITRSSFTNNLDDAGPGAAVIVAAAADGSGGAFTISDSLFSGNYASNGGAIELSNGAHGTIADSTITGNTAGGHGGGIAVDPLGLGTGTISLTLADSTIADNVADESGGGIYVAGSQDLLLVDTIVAQDTDSGGAMDDVYGPLDSTSSFNLIGDGAGETGVTAFTLGNLIGTAAAPIDPLLGPLQDNGGPTLTMAPLPGSPVIDSGGPSPTTDALFTTDQRGLPRVDDLSSVLNPYGGDGRDIGAVERQGTLTPTVLTVNTTADASPSSGTLSLRQAIEAADGTISLSSLPSSQVVAGVAGLYVIDIDATGQIALGSQLPALEGNITLNGPATGTLTILGTGQESQPVLSIASIARVSVNNLTIDGDEGGGADGILVGAGAVLSASSDVIEDLGFPPNDTTFSAGILALAGGASVTVDLSTFQELGVSGIVNGGGALSVDQSTFNNILDSGGDGAGVVNWAESGGFGGELSITRSLFENNIAGEGGAVAVLGGSTATITDSTFSNNFAAGGGGAVFAGSNAPTGGAQAVPPSLTLLRSTIVGNTASSGGGLFDNTASPVTLQDSIIAGNFTGSSPDDVSATFAAVSSNDLIGVSAGVTGLTGGQHGVQIGTVAEPLSPQLGPLQNNGGPTFTMAPLSGSPALDAGSGIVDTGTDQRGVVRGKVIDIGAYQATASQLEVIASSPATAGTAETVTVHAFDSFGMPSYDDNDTLNVSGTDPDAVLPASIALVEGSRSFSAVFRTAGPQTLTLADPTTGLTGSTTDLVVLAAAPASGTALAGTPQSALVTTTFSTALEARVVDAYGNEVPLAGVTFTVDPGASGAGATFAGGALSATVLTNPQGIAIAPALVAGGVAGTFTVSASTNGGSLDLASFALTDTAAGTITVASTPAVTTLQGQTSGLVTLATFNDPNLGAFPASSYTATVNWEDGSGTLPATVQIVGGAIAVEGSHTYLTAGSFHPVVTLTNIPTGRTATADASVTSEADITSQLSIARGGLLYNFRTGLYSATLTLTNSGTTALSGPIELAVAGLPASVTVTNAAGTTGGGQPYLLLAPPTPVAPGQSISVTISFDDPGHLLFDYALEAYLLD